MPLSGPGKIHQEFLGRVYEYFNDETQKTEFFILKNQQYCVVSFALEKKFFSGYVQRC